MSDLNVMEDGMKIASAIYHLNHEGTATKQSLKKHPLLKGISRKRLENAFKVLVNFGVVQFNRKNDDVIYWLSYPETIEDYMKTKGWLTLNKTFDFGDYIQKSWRLVSDE